MSASLFSRTERVASIFSRITGLIRGGQIKWEDRPLWYDVYASHPPFDEPVFDLKMAKSDKPLRKIFYNEDIKRASTDNSKTIYSMIDTED